MAWDISDSELSQLTTDYILSATPVDQWMTATPLLSMLRGRLEVRHEGGEEFFEPLLVTKNTSVGSYSDYDAFDISPIEQMKGARWPVKSYYGTITVSGDEEDAQAGEHAVVRILNGKVVNTRDSMLDLMATDLFSTNDDTTKGFTGLRAMLCSASSTVAGVDQSTYSWWRRGYADESTTLAELDLDAMQAVYGAVTVGMDMPDLVITTQTIWNAYWSLLQAGQTFEGPMAAGGFRTLMFNNAAVVADPYCPAGHMFFLNTKYWKLVVRSNRNFHFRPFQTPVDQDCRVAQFLFKGAVVCTRPNRQAVLTALT